jgi:hypothetical protein
VLDLTLQAFDPQKAGAGQAFDLDQEPETAQGILPLHA